MRKEKSNPNVFAPLELEKKGAKQMVTVTLMRPLYMIFTEAIVGFTCVSTAFSFQGRNADSQLDLDISFSGICNLLYVQIEFFGHPQLTLPDLFFEAYPLVFQGS